MPVTSVQDNKYVTLVVRRDGHTDELQEGEHIPAMFVKEVSDSAGTVVTVDDLLATIAALDARISELGTHH